MERARKFKLDPVERLWEYRETYLLSQTALAAELGISKQSLSRIEARQVTPDLATAVAIEYVCGISCRSWIRKDKVGGIL